MTAIYDKALKRKDFSGIVDKDKKDEKDKDKADDPKAGADIGKIVNLMSGDANRVCIANKVYLEAQSKFKMMRRLQ